MKKSKTNALRLLEQKHIAYEVREYCYDEEHSNSEMIIRQVGLSYEEVYKTLVLRSEQGYLVCCIPIMDEIDLKALAKTTHHKRVEMIHQKELFPLTGYWRGGCSPIGMKKTFPTYFQKDILLLERVAVSAGKRGLQMLLKPSDLISVTQGQCVDVTVQRQ